MTWPEPVERVAAVLRDAAVDARIEQFRGAGFDDAIYISLGD